MLRSEQYSPIRSNGVCGPPPSSLVGDSGAAARIEFQRPIGVGGNVIAPYVFGAVSNVQLERPTALESDSTDADGFGIGVRFQSRRNDERAAAITASLEYSVVKSDDADLDRDWVGASVSFHF
jgi:hemolysin activation/secretion protein